MSNRPALARGRRPASAGAAAPPLPVDSLAFALLGAARVCLGVRSGHSLRDGLDAERKAMPLRIDASPHVSDPHAAIHDLAARTLRRRGRSDALLAALGQRMPEPPLLRELLVVAIAMLVDALAPTFAADAPFDERIQDLPYPPFTLVDQAVEAAASTAELARGKGFVNADRKSVV